MKNIVFTYPTEVENEHQKLIDLFESDIDYLHVRKNDFSFGELCRYIQKIPSEFHHQIIVHNYYPIICEFDLGGINLNRKSLGQLALAQEVDKCFVQPLVETSEGIEVNKVLAKNVSYSAHSFEEIQSVYIKTNYIFLSPIFDSISKENYKSNFRNREQLRIELEKSNKNIIALGGVTEKDFTTCKDLGFSGHARLGDVWEREYELSD